MHPTDQSHPQILDFNSYREQLSHHANLTEAPKAEGDMVPMMVWMPMWVMVPKDYADAMQNPPHPN